MNTLVNIFRLLRFYVTHPAQTACWLLLKTAERLVRRFSKVGDPTFFDKKDFAWIAPIEQNWHLIRQELEQVLTRINEIPNYQDISPDQRALTQDKGWKTFFFYGYGFKSEPNCRLCPETTQLLESIPGMTTAYFSILAPGKHLPEHRGVYNGVLRYHLGLIVPEEKERCRIRVDQTIRHWSEGDSLVFDDSHLHEVWNDTKQLRVVLFVDFKRPLPQWLAWLNSGFIRLFQHTPYVQVAVKNHLAWEKTFHQDETR